MNRWLTYTIAGVVALIIALGVWFAISTSNSKSFTLTSTSPTNNANGFDPSKPIIVSYSQPLKLDQNKDNIKVSPKFAYLVEIANNTITITPNKPLAEDTSYIISLNNIQSASGGSLSSTLVFKTGRNNSPRAQFIRTLPRFNSNYTISYNSDTDSFLVTITKLPYEQAKADAMQYFKNQGLNPNTERVIYETLRSLEGKGAPPS
jgi:hypothetical protein